jgi:hypothetical protein
MGMANRWLDSKEDFYVFLRLSPQKRVAPQEDNAL